MDRKVSGFMRIYAILLAGGSGSRMNMDKPKQFLKFEDKTIMEHTVEKFVKSQIIDEIVIVMNKQYIDESKAIIDKRCYDKRISIIEGGSSRQESTFNALEYLKDKNPEIVVIHDIVRPFITDAIIRESVEEARIYGAVDVCVKTTDTIVQSSNGFIDTIPKREFLYNGQTPQVFKYEIIKKAHDVAVSEKFTDTTDDVKLVLRINEKVKIVEGSYDNVKLTTQSDIELFKKLFTKEDGRI
ncbi:MAG: 2-C-methyl-D-erythritol 4-phosphate cytidylyltransferase [Bacillota bacterium]|nr:2-C-methyl-D-erythritol 4-phosphate cytidylyltransferase [Bacillota bacterium]